MDLKLTEHDLKNMKMHERIVIDKTKQCYEWALRVPGGWIYYRQAKATPTAVHNMALCAVFVPIANATGPTVPEK